MHKLRLEVDELKVQSFEVSDHDARVGTVMAAERTLYCNTYEFETCENYTNGPGTCPADSCDNCYSWDCQSTDVSKQYVNGACV